MKATFTQTNNFFKITLIGLALVAIGQKGISQTTYQVAVTSNVYTPANITINVGDKIVWTNTQGNHNVNALQSTFPSNPESFGNSVGAGWTFEHTFNTAGFYNYQCDPHIAFGMFGTVEVEDISTSNRLATVFGSDKISLYPNPTDSYLNISINDEDNEIKSVRIYSATGALMMNKSLIESSQKVLDLSSYISGYYIIEIQGEDSNQRFKILKQ